MKKTEYYCDICYVEVLYGGFNARLTLTTNNKYQNKDMWLCKSCKKKILNYLAKIDETPIL